MSQWTFVVAAYALAGAGTFGLLLHSWLAMRAAERRGAGEG